MPKSVLIVDDERNIVISLTYLMEKSGYDVMVARDGEEALDIARSRRPDLILLDVMIPKVDGYNVCQEIRADPDLSGTKIIMLTAKGRDVEMEKGLALGADVYLTKPFSNSQLAQAVRDLLELSRA